MRSRKGPDPSAPVWEWNAKEPARYEDIGRVMAGVVQKAIREVPSRRAAVGPRPLQLFWRERPDRTRERDIPRDELLLGTSP